VGACHYNGEYVTTGREAVMTWHFDEGSYAGLTAVAVVLSDSNLADDGSRRSLLFLDGNADEATRKALASQLTKRYADTLGKVVRVHALPIRFEDDGRDLAIQVGDKTPVAQLDISRVTCDYCPMPHEVWYAPLTPVERVVVGTARTHRFADPQLKLNWTRTDENSTFIGTFTW
jgi:hypothetical protein